MYNSDGVVIVGGSIAGYNLARNLRKKGYQKKIILIDAKNTLPYDRSKLSTTWMQDLKQIEPPLFQKRDFFIDKKIKVQLNTKVKKVNSEEKIVKLDSGEEINYDKLVLATGSKLKKLDFDSGRANGVFYLRDHEDAVEIKEWSKKVKDLVIIGAGFIGLELAATFSKLGLNVTVLEYEDYPMAKNVGREVSKYFLKMHKEHGVNFITGETANFFKKDYSGKIEKVVTTEGKEIPVQMAVIAIGDLVLWPYQGENIQTAHWEHAYYHGENVAENIIKEKSQAYNARPYFWTDQYDQTFERLGYANSWDHIIVRGSLDNREFTIAYVDKFNKPLAIFFANNGDKRKEVSQFMDYVEKIDEEKFKDIKIPLKKSIEK